MDLMSCLRTVIPANRNLLGYRSTERKIWTRRLISTNLRSRPVNFSYEKCCYRKSKGSLPLLYDELESKLRSLESLGKTQDKYGDFLTPLVESCLPEEVLVAWERNRNHQTESEGSRSLEQLMNFLQQEVKGEEMVLLARTGLTFHQNPRKKDYRATQSKGSLPLLYDELESKLRSLESLGKTQDKYGDFLTPLVESCLPEEVLVAWERNRNHQTESEGSRSLEQLMNFLQQEVKGEEMVLLARTGLTFHQNPRKKDYRATQDWEKLNIIERVPDLELNKECHYLAHRPVIKLASQTTKIRPIFDASASEKGKPLNECLLKGTNLIELLPDILDRFRMYPICISADIERALLMLSVAPKDGDFLRLFSPCSEGRIVYRHCRVVFGVSSIPFLLNASFRK
ncbi:uncharacterized protein TNCV_1062711 [Trichonephila clavipes]|nr:uncharacterized protein TNCV_1062711 [Trichonephila clavipes]